MEVRRDDEHKNNVNEIDVIGEDSLSNDRVSKSFFNNTSRKTPKRVRRLSQATQSPQIDEVSFPLTNNPA